MSKGIAQWIPLVPEIEHIQLLAKTRSLFWLGHFRSLSLGRQFGKETMHTAGKRSYNYSFNINIYMYHHMFV